MKEISKGRETIEKDRDREKIFGIVFLCIVSGRSME
jgi:hypothetical protein